MKKIFALLLALICLTFTFTGCDTTENNTGNVPSPAKDFEFEADENGLTVTKYLGSAKKIVIPSVVDNKKVIGIKPDVFGGNIVVEEIVLSNYMTEPYFECFQGCDNLKTLTYSGIVDYFSTFYASFLPNNLTTIIFPSLKSINVSTFDAIHDANPNTNTFICSSATEIMTIKFDGEKSFNGGYNFILPDTLVNRIKNMTAYYYNHTNNNIFANSTGYHLAIPFTSTFTDGKTEPTDKSKIDSEIINEIESLCKNTIKKDYNVIDAKFSLRESEFGEEITCAGNFELIYEISNGSSSYILGSFSYIKVNGQIYNEKFHISHHYEFVESINDPNIVFTTAFGRVDSITVNGTTYSYDHK